MTRRDFGSANVPDNAPGSIPDFSAVIDWLRSVAPEAHLCSDTRQLSAGDVFLAHPGLNSDGRNYLQEAQARGAVAVVVEEGDGFEWPADCALPHRGLAGLQRGAGALAREWYGAPDAGMLTVAATGTNGKTSCTQWLASALSQVDGPVAVIGTLGAGLWVNGKPREFSQTGFTTPDPVQLQRRLAELRAEGAWALAIEASSIGLQQGRLDALHFDAALFTNLTRDHLDYHGDMASYESAKGLLFDWPGLQDAVINLDDEAGLRLAQRLLARGTVGLIGYSLKGVELEGLPVLQASEIRSTRSGTGFNLTAPWGTAPVRTQLVGKFNVANMLGIAGLLLTRGIEWQTVIDLIESLHPVPGRMEQLGGQDAPLVVIDYAHTPDALEKTLATLREVATERNGRLWCLFGCGGDRDPGKRAQMGAVAMAADEVVITSDNPRSEEPAAIIAQIVAGTVGNAARPPQVIEDRAAAILWAIRHASRADVVLLAGKGHEDYQEIKGRKQSFRDADHAALALLSRATMKGNT